MLQYIRSLFPKMCPLSQAEAAAKATTDAANEARQAATSSVRRVSIAEDKSDGVSGSVSDSTAQEDRETVNIVDGNAGDDASEAGDERGRRRTSDFSGGSVADRLRA